MVLGWYGCHGVDDYRTFSSITPSIFLLTGKNKGVDAEKDANTNTNKNTDTVTDVNVDVKNLNNRMEIFC